MRRPTALYACAALMALTPAADAHAQVRQIPASTLLATGTEWVSGVAEPASGRFIVYAEEKAIRIYNRATKRTTMVPIAVPEAFGSSLSISRSGHRLAFPRSAERTDDRTRLQAHIWTLDLDTLTGVPVGEARRVSLVPALNASISPDGRFIALAANDRNAWGIVAGQRMLIIPSQGGNERMLDSGSLVMTPRWSADGRTVFYASEHKVPVLMRASADGKVRDSIGTLLRGQTVTDISPDGRSLLITGQWMSSINEVRDLNGKSVARFAVDPWLDRLYAWSRTDPRTLVGTRRLEPATLKSVPLTGGSPAPFAVTEPFSNEPVYSPDGSRVAMPTKVGEQSAIVVHELRIKQRRVINVSFDPDRLAWSPDGGRIAFIASDSMTMLRTLFVADVTTGSTRPLATSYQSGTFRWRNDGRAIDLVQGHIATGREAPEIHRINMAGARTIVRVLPVPDNDNNGPIRVVSDSLVLVGMKDRLLAVPLGAGETRTIYSGSAASPPSDARSPDGKWIATSVTEKGVTSVAIVSLDGKSVRRLGLSSRCDAGLHAWLPDGTGLIAWRSESCNDWLEDVFLVPVDGSPARPLKLPPHHGFTLTPDGRALVVAVDELKRASIMSYDLTKVGPAPLSGAGGNRR